MHAYAKTMLLAGETASNQGVASAAPAKACSAAEAATARDAFEKATSGDTAGGMALLTGLEGGAAGPCASCLLANVATPEKAIPECVGMSWQL